MITSDNSNYSKNENPLFDLKQFTEELANACAISSLQLLDISASDNDIDIVAIIPDDRSPTSFLEKISNITVSKIVMYKKFITITPVRKAEFLENNSAFFRNARARHVAREIIVSP